MGLPTLFLYRKLRSLYKKKLRADAHLREAEICRKRLRSAQECALHILYSIIVNSIKQLTTVANCFILFTMKEG